jgi:hypothetical protein
MAHTTRERESTRYRVDVACIETADLPVLPQPLQSGGVPVAQGLLLPPGLPTLRRSRAGESMCLLMAQVEQVKKGVSIGKAPPWAAAAAHVGASHGLGNTHNLGNVMDAVQLGKREFTVCFGRITRSH